MNTYTQSELFTINELMNVFVISDHHFYHENIIKYCERQFKNLNHMHNVMIKNWNNVVSKDDVVLHLGDFSFGNKKMVKDIRRKLNGKIYMIKGNHDKHGVGWYNDVGIMMFKKPFIIGDILFSHARKNTENINTYIHGHSHDKRPLIESIDNNKFYNVSVDKLNYTPIKIKDLLKL